MSLLSIDTALGMLRAGWTYDGRFSINLADIVSIHKEGRHGITVKYLSPNLNQHSWVFTSVDKIEPLLGKILFWPGIPGSLLVVKEFLRIKGASELLDRVKP